MNKTLTSKQIRLILEKPSKYPVGLVFLARELDQKRKAWFDSHVEVIGPHSGEIRKKLKETF